MRSYGKNQELKFRMEYEDYGKYSDWKEQWWARRAMGQKSEENTHTCFWNWLMRKILEPLIREYLGDRGISASQEGCWVGANQSWKGPRGCISEFAFGYSHRKRWCWVILNTTAPGQLNQAGKMLREICVQVNLERGLRYDNEDGGSLVIGLTRIKW